MTIQSNMSVTNYVLNEEAAQIITALLNIFYERNETVTEIELNQKDITQYRIAGYELQNRISSYQETNSTI